MRVVLRKVLLAFLFIVSSLSVAHAQITYRDGMPDPFLDWVIDCLDIVAPACFTSMARDSVSESVNQLWNLNKWRDGIRETFDWGTNTCGPAKRGNLEVYFSTYGYIGWAWKLEISHDCRFVDTQNRESISIKKYVASGKGYCGFGYSSSVDGGRQCFLPKEIPDVSENADACPATSKPVVLATGAKRVRETDIPSKESGLVGIARTYNSLISRDGSVVAPRWLHTYSRSISMESEVRAHVYRHTGVSHLAAPESLVAKEGRQSWNFLDATNLRLYRVFNASGEGSGWLLFDFNANEVEEYDHRGQLLRVSKAWGGAQTLLYSSGIPGGDGEYALDDSGEPSTILLPSGQLLSVSDSFGRTLIFGYDKLFRLARITDVSGLFLQYVHDEMGNLIQVVYPSKHLKRYFYGESLLTGGVFLPWALTGVVDENKVRLASYRYDNSGRVVESQWWIDKEQTLPADRSTVHYGESVATVTNGMGVISHYSFSSIGRKVLLTSQSQPAGAGCGPASSSITYDANANVSSRTDFNNHKTCYAYDLARNLETQRVEGLDAAATCSTALTSPPTTDTTRVITTQWHPDWRLETRRAEPRRITTWVYNGYGANCAPADALVDGKPIAVVCSKTEQATTDETGALGFAAVASGAARTWSYSYNRWGQILTSNGPRSDVVDTTTYEYYPDTQPNWTFGDLKQTTNAAGHITRFTKYNRHGQVLERIDPNGLTTQYTYDLRQRLTSITVGDEKTAYSYDPVGNLIQTTLPDGSTLTHTYDAAHRLIQTKDNKGNTIDYTLDAMGNRIAEKTLDASGALVRNVTRAMDALNRVQSVVGE